MAITGVEHHKAVVNQRERRLIHPTITSDNHIVLFGNGLT